jgi:hypothetical protein
VKPEKRIKRRAANFSLTQTTEKPDPYRTSGTSLDNRGNASTGMKCDGRHNGFATMKGLPEKSGRTQPPKRILMTRDKRRRIKNKIRA